MSRTSKGRDGARRMRAKVLTDLDNRIVEFVASRNLPPFGSQLGLVNGDIAADALVTHRWLKKFEVPVKGNDEARRQRSIRKMLEVDQNQFPIHFSDAHRMAKARLGYWFKGFKPSYRAVFPSGSSSFPTGTENDMAAKLTNEQCWEVSPSLFGYAATIFYRNHALKRLVRKRFRERYPYLEMNSMFREKIGAHDGFQIFKEMFRCLVNFNATVRITTVPKDNDNDRVIGCVPFLDMVCQLSFAMDMRKWMRRHGVWLEKNGDLHKTLLHQKDIGTLDLSTASDLVQKLLIETLWPDHMWKYLRILRPTVFEYELDGEKGYHTPAMYAPMGTGMTFDVMSFTLLALLRSDRSATVFGDDIITKKPEEALKILRDSGLKVNVEKSFITGKFRESCGGYWHDDIGLITSYDFKYPKDACDEFTIINKMSMIIQANQISSELKALFIHARNKLLSTYPALSFGEDTLELDSSCIRGFSRDQFYFEPKSEPRKRLAGEKERKRETSFKDWLGSMRQDYQREVTVTLKLVKEALPSGVVICPHVLIVSHLLRGVVDITQRDNTQIYGRTSETFSNRRQGNLG